jgi:acetyltransferase EpsM
MRGSLLVNDYIIYGAGGHAKVIIDCIEQLGNKVIGVIDDDPTKVNTTILDYPVLGSYRHMVSTKFHLKARWIIAIGDNASRKRIATEVLDKQIKYGVVVHPKAIVSKYSEIQNGVVIIAGAVVNCSTYIGEHTIINTGATVGHDVQIEPYCHIAPGVHLGGGAIVDEGTFVGIGASVLPNRRIGRWSVIGAGSVVVDDIPDEVIAVGVPARIVRRIDNGEVDKI